jgi:hypothetical protein
MRRAFIAAAIAASCGAAATFVIAQSGIAFRDYSVQVRRIGNEDIPNVQAVADGVKAALGDGWTLTFDDATNPFNGRIVPSNAPKPPTLSAAWSGVHRLHGTNLFVLAEPTFNTPVPLQPGETAGAWPGECDPSWKGTSAATPDKALLDSTWSLGPLGANVFEAWKLPTGLGQDVAIAHPDTGYLYHPSVTPALLGRGFNFPDRRSDAIDTADDGSLQWPGHGTRTSSVIAGRSFQLSNHWISGVAPSAHVMPLKVAHRVVLLDWIEYDMEQLARAIRAAAIGDPNFVRRKADIISMSLGGAPNSKVEAALAVAEANNVIVLAAAGNQVPTRQVVYPARYSNVIAVAASNYDRSNWEFSSKGSAIAVSAPGQNVWTAKYRLIGERPYFCIEPSSGTSYAVATTAGVAALWLSYHRKTLSERPDIDRSKTFKALAACTAKPFDKVSDPADYGGGIIDAAALLAEPLPERDGPTWNQSGPCARALRAVPPRPLS